MVPKPKKIPICRQHFFFFLLPSHQQRPNPLNGQKRKYGIRLKDTKYNP